MTKDLICAVDVGTSGVKVAAFTPTGTVVASSARDYGIDRAPDGRAEQSPRALRLATLASIAEVVAATGQARIATVAVSSQRASFVALDENCQPLTPLISWQDHRATSQCATLRSRIGDSAYYRLTGLTIAPTAAISKIMWLKEMQPHLFSRVRWFASHQAMALLDLDAKVVCSSYSDASYMGLLDINTRTWSKQLCDAIGVHRDLLGRIAESGSIAGEVSDEASSATGLATGTPLVLAGGDLQCGALGVGAVDAGTISVGLGTGGHCVSSIDKPLLHSRRATSCQAHVIPLRWEVEGIALATSASFQWLADELGAAETAAGKANGRSRYEEIINRATTAPAGSDGLLVLPTLNGAGTPYWRPDVRGTILGLSSSHTRATLYRAFLEGICYEMRGVLDALCETGIAADELRAWGGPARSLAWTQILCNVFGKPLTVSHNADAGLVGAAVLAAVGAGLHADVESAVAAMVDRGHTIEPAPDLVATYERGYHRYAEALAMVMNSAL